MSAYVVNKTTIDAVVRLISLPDEAPSALGAALWAMNAAAVAARYATAPYEPEPYRYEAPSGLSHEALLKAATCLAYQCTEGDVPESPLYQRIRAGLDAEILTRSTMRHGALWPVSSAYQSASWGVR